MLAAGAHVEGNKADSLAITASVLCAVHCLLAPVILIAFPSFAMLASEVSAFWVHLAAALVVVPLALVSLQLSSRYHSRTWPRMVGLLGSVCIIVALFPYWTQLAPVAWAWGDMAVGVETGNVVGGVGGLTENEVHVGDTCCPTFTSTDTGGVISLPWSSIITLAGSFLLIAAHTGNICCKKSDCQA